MQDISYIGKNFIMEFGLKFWVNWNAAYQNRSVLVMVYCSCGSIWVGELGFFFQILYFALDGWT